MKIFEYINSEEYKEKEKEKSGKISKGLSTVEKSIKDVNSKLEELRKAYGAVSDDSLDVLSEEEGVYATVTGHSAINPCEPGDNRGSDYNIDGLRRLLVDLRNGASDHRPFIEDDYPDTEPIGEEDDGLPVERPLSDFVVEGTPPSEATLREISERYNIRVAEEECQAQPVIGRNRAG